MKKKSFFFKLKLDLIIFFFFLSVFSLRLLNFVLIKEKNSPDTRSVSSEIDYWKSVALENENYPDSWVKLAICWQKIGENDLSKLAIEKARKIDPLREDIKNVEQQLNLRYNK